MPKRANARDVKLTPYDKLFQSTDPTNKNTQDIDKLSLSELHPFKNHPFKLYSDEKMREMVDSVRQNGVLMPILVRPENDGNGYEIISGHNRVEAAKQAGLHEIPATVREMDDETAVIAMVDSNLRQREKLLPSEKARAYRMKLEAIKRKAGRPPQDNSGQVDQNIKAKLFGRSIEGRQKTSIKISARMAGTICQRQCAPQYIQWL